MRILFCNIAWMDYYQGKIEGEDEPKNGGSYVSDNDDANEKYNFQSESLTKDSGYQDGDYCFGFVETKSTNGRDPNQLHIEKIEGCSLLKNSPEVEDVLVVYCAKCPDPDVNATYVVGWYKHATVYRNYALMSFINPDDSVYDQSYNAIAKKENCVLLPSDIRQINDVWKVPRRRAGSSYGFGQANVWFAQGADENPELRSFLDRIVKQIEEYDGENWVDTFKDKNFFK